MRVIFLAVLGLAIMATPAAAQPGKDKAAEQTGKDKGKEKGKDKTPDWPKEVGGKNVDQWIAEITSKDRSKSERAIQTVIAFGPGAKKAIPILAAELRKHKPADGAVLEISIRVNGAAALATLIPFYDKPEAKEVQDGISALVGQLKDNQIIVRLRTIQALANLGPAAQSAIPELITLTRDRSSYELRQAACLAIGMTVPVDKEKGPLNQTAVNALYTALDDSTSPVRHTAIQSLLRIGAHHFATHKGKFEKDVGHCAKTDVDPLVRLRANMALLGVRKEADKSHITAVANFLEHKDPIVRAEAATALGTLGPDAKDCLPQLIGGFKDADPNIALLCVVAVGRMEKAGAGALRALEALATDKMKPEELRDTAKDAIRYVTGEKTLKQTPPDKGGGK